MSKCEICLMREADCKAYTAQYTADICWECHDYYDHDHITVLDLIYGVDRGKWMKPWRKE